MKVFERQYNGFTISTDPARLQLDVIHGFLERSYWAAGIPREVVVRSIRNSLCFGAYHGTDQIGFARAITDSATVACLADVFIVEEWQGRGLSMRLMECILSHPDLQGLRRWHLCTRDAHRLYEKFGFRIPPHPELHMELHHPDIYRSPAGGGEPTTEPLRDRRG